MAQPARVQVANPRPKRAKKRRHKETAMPRKKRRRRARSRAANPTKKTRRKKRRNPTVARAQAANPKKRRARKRRHNGGVRVRAAVGNPRRKRRTRKRRHNPARFTSARRSTSNPRRKGRRGKRRHRRNPGLPMWAVAGLAGLAGLGAYVVAQAGSYVATQHLDPTMADYTRNRRILSGLLAAGGVGVAALLGSPVIGAGIAAGALASLAGTEAYQAVGLALGKSSTGAVNRLPGMGAVNQLPGMGAVENLGALVPASWASN
jgi:hypothetical protein